MPAETAFTLDLATMTAALLVAALILYTILGGADYGGGVWDLLASGPRRREQRKLIETAIGPVWEANHVWLIFVIVILFSAFPSAFAALSTALHIPLTLMLIGIVLRGTAFTFRHYDRQDDNVQQRWGRIFSIASVFTPVMLGICIGAIASGGIRVQNGVVTSGFIYPWFGLFPLIMGLFALALFAFLAAVFLAVEAQGRALKEDFCRRALYSAVAVGVLALIAFLLSDTQAPLVRHGLTGRAWSWPLHILTGIGAVGTIFAIFTNRFQLARVMAAVQVTLILSGWILAQYPYLVPPDIRLQEAAAPDSVLSLVLIASACGALILGPSLFYLFRIFKGQKAFEGVE